MGPTARTHYPRQCKNQTPVQVEETRTSIKWSNRVPRKLTERRKTLIREFLQIFLEKSHMYAAYGTEPWIDSLLHYMNERPSYGLAPVDVKIWMGNEKFFNSEVIRILCMDARHGNPRVGIQRERAREICDVPAVQPHPNHSNIAPDEIQSTQRDIIPGEILSSQPEHGVETEIAPEAIPLSADPHEIEPEMEPMGEPMEVDYDFVAPLPPPLGGFCSDTLVIVRELRDSWTRTFIAADERRLSSSSTTTVAAAVGGVNVGGDVEEVDPKPSKFQKLRDMIIEGVDLHLNARQFEVEFHVEKDNDDDDASSPLLISDIRGTGVCNVGGNEQVEIEVDQVDAKLRVIEGEEKVELVEEEEKVETGLNSECHDDNADNDELQRPQRHHRLFGV
ncbi:unnamed protein product [Orchesella dallaii]|uniref:Uncharacterized protein n=1 Tax=Orchesella dallaii TaxID=48710 RepID=A0ABP1PVK5_9HEXA